MTALGRLPPWLLRRNRMSLMGRGRVKTLVRRASHKIGPRFRGREFIAECFAHLNLVRIAFSPKPLSVFTQSRSFSPSWPHIALAVANWRLPG